MSGTVYSVSDISFNVVRGNGESTVEYHIVRNGNYIAARCWDYSHAKIICSALNKLEESTTPSYEEADEYIDGNDKDCQPKDIKSRHKDSEK
jgi:hypothetical protein